MEASVFTWRNKKCDTFIFDTKIIEIIDWKNDSNYILLISLFWWAKFVNLSNKEKVLLIGFATMLKWATSSFQIRNWWVYSAVISGIVSAMSFHPR